jgi:hypothetical protein
MIFYSWFAAPPLVEFVSACYTLIESGILVAAISWTGSSQLSMRFVMTMKKVKEGTDTAQTGEVVKDPQVEGVLLVLTAEGGRGVAQTTEEARRGGAQTMVGEDAALIMAGEDAAPIMAGE